jgi:hypothetical protein
MFFSSLFLKHYPIEQKHFSSNNQSFSVAIPDSQDNIYLWSVQLVSLVGMKRESGVIPELYPQL